VIRNAITRERKVETVEKLVESLERSAVVVGLRYQGLTVKQVQSFRKQLPKESSLLVCKNTLMKMAVDKVDGWSELKPACQGDNAWLFVGEEVIADSFKAYNKFEKSLIDALPKDQRDGVRPIDVSGGVMDGKALDYAAVKRLEKLPTKKELIATIARLIKMVPTKLAYGVKAVPTKLAYGVKALADAESEDKSVRVGDVLPKA